MRKLYGVILGLCMICLMGCSDRKEETMAKQSQEEEKLQSGIFDVFYGPIRDNTGKLRVEEGENLSDYTMLNRFDWYVEGVVIHE